METVEPFAIDVDEPASLGADRAVNTIAAHALHKGDLIVIDFGTATTFDVVDYTGAYKGGIIAPGINLSLDALVTAAAKLPRIRREHDEANPPDAQPRLQGEGGAGRDQGREDAGGVGEDV